MVNKKDSDGNNPKEALKYYFLVFEPASFNRNLRGVANFILFLGMVALISIGVILTDWSYLALAGAFFVMFLLGIITMGATMPDLFDKETYFKCITDKTEKTEK